MKDGGGGGRGGGGVALLLAFPASEIYLDRAHAVIRAHMVAHAVLMVKGPGTACHWQHEHQHGRAPHLRKSVAAHAHVWEDSHGVLGHVLHDVSHHGQGREIVTERRCVPSWRTGHVLAK